MHVFFPTSREYHYNPNCFRSFGAFGCNNWSICLLLVSVHFMSVLTFVFSSSCFIGKCLNYYSFNLHLTSSFYVVSLKCILKRLTIIMKVFEHYHRYVSEYVHIMTSFFVLCCLPRALHELIERLLPVQRL